MLCQNKNLSVVLFSFLSVFGKIKAAVVMVVVVMVMVVLVLVKMVIVMVVVGEGKDKKGEEYCCNTQIQQINISH